MEFFGLPGEPLVPLFCLFANRARLVPIISISPVSLFSHSFLLSALILLKVPGWPSSLGCAEVCPSRHPHFWRLPHFPFLSHLGGILFCHFWKSFVIILLPCSSSSRLFSVCAMRGRSRSFCFCFLFSSSVFFYRAVLVFLCLCAWRDLCLLMVLEDPCFLSLIVILFFWMLLCLGFRIPWAFLFLHGFPASATMGLAWFFLLGLTYPFGLDLFFWASFTMILFRPQHLAPRARGLPEAHAWVI